MGLFVSTVSTNIALSELGITLTHPVTDYRLDTQFNSEEIGNALSLTAAITSGTLTWRKTAGGTIETAASYDPDYLEIEQLNAGTQITIDPAQVNNLAATIRGTILTGIDFSVNLAIAASDTILGAFGKIQKQLTDHIGVAGSVHPAVTTTVNGFMIATDKVKLDAIKAAKTAADLTNSSNATSVSISDLSVTCVVGKSYHFVYSITYKSAATNTGLAISLNGTAVGGISAFVQMAANDTVGNLNPFTGPITALTNYVAVTTVGTANTLYTSLVTGVFTCTTAGTFFPIFRSSRNGTLITVVAGSSMYMREI